MRNKEYEEKTLELEAKVLYRYEMSLQCLGKDEADMEMKRLSKRFHVLCHASDEHGHLVSAQLYDDGRVVNEVVRVLPKRAYCDGVYHDFENEQQLEDFMNTQYRHMLERAYVHVRR